MKGPLMGLEGNSRYSLTQPGLLLQTGQPHLQREVGNFPASCLAQHHPEGEGVRAGPGLPAWDPGCTGGTSPEGRPSGGERVMSGCSGFQFYQLLFLGSRRKIFLKSSSLPLGREDKGVF